MKTFPMPTVNQEFCTETTAALTRLEQTLPKSAHYSLELTARVQRFAAGNGEHVGVSWQCCVLDGQDSEGRFDFQECRSAKTPLDAVQKILDKWRRWKLAEDAAALKANDLQQMRYDADHEQDRFDGGRLS